MEEIWKNVTNFEHKYEVSNLGNVRKKATQESLKGGIYSGFHRVHLTTGTKTDPLTRNYGVHLLVAQHFVENPNNKKTVYHLDGNKLNNRADNIAFGRKSNARDIKLRDFICPDIIEVDDTHDDEQWANVLNFENHYQISTYGRIYSKYNKKLAPTHINVGFIQVYLANVTNSKYKTIHRLVAQAFIDNPNNFNIVEHRNGDVNNNHVNNIRWSRGGYAAKLRRNMNRKRTVPIKRKKKSSKNKAIVNIVDEIWVNIKKYETRYQISNFGNVKNKRRNKPLTPVIVSGYHTVQLSHRKYKPTRFTIHRLVAQHFIENKYPDIYDKVDHIDNNKLNNRVDNLRWVNQSINIQSYVDNYKPEMDKPILQYDLDNNFMREWKSILKIIEEYDYTMGMLYLALNGKSYTAYGYIWAYKYNVTNNVKFEDDEVFVNVGIINNRNYSRYEISNYGKIKSLKYNKIL